MSKGQRFLDEIQNRVLVGDGATGTALFARGAEPDQGVERLNFLNPDLVLGLHREYIDAGSQVIETNTYAANRLHLARYGAEEDVREIILAGVRLARQAAGDAVYVAGAVGPLPTIDGEPASKLVRTALFAEQLNALLEGGVDILLLESFGALDELLDAIMVARSMSDAPIIAQMAFEAGGLAYDGNSADVVAERCLAAGANMVGANCGYGVPSIVQAIKRMSIIGAPMSAFMNAGFPEQVEGRQFYLATPEYLAGRACQLAELGVRLIGGCCGTEPATIRAIAQALAEPARVLHTIHTPEPRTIPIHHDKKLPSTLTSSGFPILVELDPPTNVDVAPLMDAAVALKEAGATAITVADNPLASVRLDSVTLASLIQNSSGIATVPHLTGRDRNRIALQSTIMAAYVQGIRSLLGITGDPIRMCSEPNTSGVFDVTSIGLVNLISEFNAGLMTSEQTGFSIGVAVNPNVRSLSGQINKLGRKAEAGANFALTQPIFEFERLEMLKEALKEANIDIPIYIGVLPLLSSRNAEFLHNEVPGIMIPDQVRERIARYENPQDQRAVGIEVASELVEQFAPHVDGFYFITPRNKVEAVLPLLKVAQTFTRSAVR